MSKKYFYLNLNQDREKLETLFNGEFNEKEQIWKFDLSKKKDILNFIEGKINSETSNEESSMSESDLMSETDSETSDLEMPETLLSNELKRLLLEKNETSKKRFHRSTSMSNDENDSF
jgi:hypothetical protein